jgi:hypothetical protein
MDNNVSSRKNNATFAALNQKDNNEQKAKIGDITSFQ